MTKELEDRLAALEASLPKAQPARGSKTKKNILIVGLLLVVVGVSIGAYLLLAGGPSPSASQTQMKEQLAQYRNQVNFPLYAPNKLPQGYRMKTDSLSAQNTMVSFILENTGGSPLIVTEQPRPPIMEDVKKVSDVDSPAGKAYIADLGGRYTGFIVADKTLVVISGAQQSESDKLRELLGSFRAL